MAASSVWAILLLVYAPPQAAPINWVGSLVPNEPAIVGKNLFGSETECHQRALAWITKINEGVKTPVLFRCVKFPGNLEAG